MILQVNKSNPAPGIGLLELRGRLMMGNDSKLVEWSLTELLKDGVKKVVMDLRALETLDSTGVGILVMCHGKVQKEGGSSRIVAPAGLVLDTLMMTHVDRLVPFCPTVEEATKELASS